MINIRIDWNKAPEWANYHAFNNKGKGIWFETHPAYGIMFWNSDGIEEESGNNVEQLPDDTFWWTGSIEERPLDKYKDLIPFNLDKALAGEPVITRNGLIASQITLYEINSPYKVLAIIDDQMNSFTVQGKKWARGNENSDLDLFMAPVTQVLNGYVVPRPITEPLSKGEQYIIPNVFYKDWYEIQYWNNDCNDNTWLKRGLVFKTKEDAIAVAKAMIGLDPEKDHDN